MGTELIEGWYCGAPGQALSDPELLELAQSLRIDKCVPGKSAARSGSGSEQQPAVIDWKVAEVIRTTPVGREARHRGGRSR